MSERQLQYKNVGRDAKELRRQREVTSEKLRKQKRDDFLCKKRTLAPINHHEDQLIDEDDRSGLDRSDVSLSETLTPDMIEALIQNTDNARILDGAQRVRKLLSIEPKPPFDEVIQSGVIPRLVQLLDHEDNLIQFEVAWVLTNICSGTTEQTRVVVESGALPKLIDLMRSPDPRVCEQAVWALGNIVGDNGTFRDLVISLNFVPQLLNLIHPGLEIGFLRNATWVLVNLCRNKEPPSSIEIIEQLGPALMFLIESNDQTILIDTTWAISYITELGPQYSQLIIDLGLVKKMTKLISHEETKIKTAAIRALGCIATGSDEQTQAVVDAGAIPELRKAFDGVNDRVAKDALWFLSNVVAGSQDQIQAVIDADLAPLIIHFLSTGDYHQQKEASWAVFNFCLTGSPKQLQVLVDLQVVPALCGLLDLVDNTLIRNVLDALRSLLRKCDGEDRQVRDQIEECGGLDKIDSLQNSENQEIYQYSYNIIDQFFSDNDNTT